MVYVKSVLVGIVAGVVAAVIWILAVFVLPVGLPFLLRQVIDDGTGGVGASYATISSASITGVALVGFLVGFFWRLRRSPKTEAGRGSK